MEQVGDSHLSLWNSIVKHFDTHNEAGSHVVRVAGIDLIGVKIPAPKT